MYLYERKYKGQIRNNNTQKYNYWEKLLGRNVFEIFLNNYRNFRFYLCDSFYEGKEKNLDGFIEGVMNYQEEYVDSFVKNENSLYFAEFYNGVIRFGVYLFQLKNYDKNISKEIMIDFGEQMAVSLQDICIRTLIVEMHDFDERGQLKENESKEKYECFCKEIIIKKDFVKRVFEKYPVLCRCMAETVENMVNFYTDILKWFQKDKKAIQ